MPRCARCAPDAPRETQALPDGDGAGRAVNRARPCSAGIWRMRKAAIFGSRSNTAANKRRTGAPCELGCNGWTSREDPGHRWGPSRNRAPPGIVPYCTKFQQDRPLYGGVPPRRSATQLLPKGADRAASRAVPSSTGSAMQSSHLRRRRAHRLGTDSRRQYGGCLCQGGERRSPTLVRPWWQAIPVGTRVTPRPPDRSDPALLPHSAPTSGV